jgi:guanylate kinase
MISRDNFLALVPQLVDTYQANSSVLQHLKDITFVALVSPTGMGKTTLLDQSGWPAVVSDTTRSRRSGEQPGKDMHFRTDYQVLLDQIRRGEFVQIARGPQGDLYGSRAESYPSGGVAANAVVSDAIPVFRTLGFKTVHSVFITAPNYTEWQRRLHARGDGPEEAMRRLPEAKRSLQAALADPRYVFVLNGNVSDAVKDLHSVVSGSYPEARNAEARNAAAAILAELEKRSAN